jgi:hypothetical protein
MYSCVTAARGTVYVVMIWWARTANIFFPICIHALRPVGYRNLPSLILTPTLPLTLYLLCSIFYTEERHWQGEGTEEQAGPARIYQCYPNIFGTRYTGP